MQFNLFNFSQVLIIGGGDGGVAREVVKHPLVESVVQCEIDEDVINAARKYLPNMAVGFDSPKLTLHIGDGFEFMKNHQAEFDVIIADTSDPDGTYILQLKIFSLDSCSCFHFYFGFSHSNEN